ncbi:MAG TPA: DUF2892 domain-containing protein [bacterium]|nr:DUF2892 domain-containing protein [bacterium]
MRGCTGTTDRVIRALIGIVALGAGLTQAAALGPGWAYTADAVGVIGIATGILGRCPLYLLFGMQTCGRPA